MIHCKGVEMRTTLGPQRHGMHMQLSRCQTFKHFAQAPWMPVLQPHSRLRVRRAVSPGRMPHRTITAAAISTYANEDDYSTQESSVHSLTCRFYEYLNARDLPAMFSLLSPDITYTNTALKVEHIGKQAVSRFYIQVLGRLPQQAALVLDEVAVSLAPEPPMQAFSGKHAPDSQRVSVAWHLELAGIPVPGSHGNGLIRWEPSRGGITSLQDCPQPHMQVLLPALGAMTPAVDVTAALWMPVASLFAGRGVGGEGFSAQDPFGFPQNLVSMLPTNLLPWANNLKGTCSTSNHSTDSVISNSRRSPATGSNTTRLTYGTWTGGRAQMQVNNSTGNSNGQIGNRAEPTSTPGSKTASSSLSPSTSSNTRATGNIGSSTSSKALTSNSINGAQAARSSARVSKPAYNIPMRGLKGVTAAANAADITTLVTDAVSVETSTKNTTDGDQIIQASYEDIKEPANISGVWEKDTEASQPDLYDKMLDLLRLSGMQKVTARLIEGIEIKQEGENFIVNFLTVVPFFKVTETTKFNKPSKISRRDLQPGTQNAMTTRTPDGVRIAFEWGSPNPGTLTEEYRLVSGRAPGTGPRVMTVTSHLEAGGRSADVVQVYRCSGKNKEQLLTESRQRNGSVNSVLAAQKARGRN